MAPVQVYEAGFENDGIEKRSLHRHFSLFPENYVPSFPLDSLVIMKPVMDIENIKSANVMKTPEKPKANTLRAIVQSVTDSPSVKIVPP